MRLSTLRLRYGLFWRGRYPPVARPAFLVFVIFLLYVLASTMDYLLQEVQAKEAVESYLSAWQKVGINCANQAMEELKGRRANNHMIFDEKIFAVNCLYIEDHRER